jgi:hypothetical protein
MPRRNARPELQRGLELTAATSLCPACHGPLWAACKSHRAVVTLDGPVRLAIQVRRCRMSVARAIERHFVPRWKAVSPCRNVSTAST